MAGFSTASSVHCDMILQKSIILEVLHRTIAITVGSAYQNNKTHVNKATE